MTAPPMLRAEVADTLHRGVVIPACPLALDARKRLDERRQRALLRYYGAAGASGVAVAVHTTQFEIRDPAIGLFKPVLELAAETLAEVSDRRDRALVRVAGVCGRTPQAVAEAELAAFLGYDLALVSLGALKEATERELLDHCRALSAIIPLMGFYLQPAVGGRVLPYAFWRRFVEIENVCAIKIAPFNRYQTLDVVRAVADAGVEERVALYTGNDDNIIADLITPYTLRTPSGPKTLRIRGGLLGQWSIWTSRAVEILFECHRAAGSDGAGLRALLGKNVAVTDANSVVFDAAHNFTGCIPGINEVLRRQGLMAYSHCLDPRMVLAPGQVDELDRIYRDYPWLTDDAFVRDHLDEWLR
jgi:hypothetical protein